MFTQKAVTYFFLASLLLALSLLLQDPQLAVLVLPLASLFFLSNALGIPEDVDLQIVRRVMPTQTFGDEEVRIESVITNNGDAALSSVEAHEVLPASFNLKKGANRVATVLGPNESIEMSAESDSPNRGHYTIGPLIVRVQDPFGLYLVEKRLEPETLVVMPKPERMRIGELRPRHLGPWPGVIPSKILGHGTEFFSLREYVAGDDPKRINWKASARYRRLITNETEAERVTDAMIVLDTDVTFFEPSETELFESGITAAASIASLLIRQGNRVGLILQGDERGVVPPGFGKRHERRILSLLAAARPGRPVISTSFVITLLARLMLPARSQMILISPLLDSAIIDGVRQLATEGYSILVLAPFPRPPREFVSESEELASRMLMLERSNTLLALEKICAVVEWSTAVPLSTRLSRVKRVRPRIQMH